MAPRPADIDRRAARLIGIYMTMPADGLDGFSCRDHDNQWEAGDGDAVLARLQEIARASADFARAVLSESARRYAPPALLKTAEEARRV